MVELRNVVYTYPGASAPAINGMDLTVNKGDFAFIVGSSGAGKSSIIKLLLKEINAESGDVNVNGFNLCTLKYGQIPYFRRTIGVVFQDFRLIPTMTVYDNVAFVLRALGQPHRYIDKRVPYTISLVGLVDKVNRYPSELSGGEQQRVALARALVNDPQLILADEPTGNVDPERSFEIVDLMKNINAKARTTILMVTHEHEMVRFFGGRVISVEQGQVVYDEYIEGNQGD